MLSALVVVFALLLDRLLGEPRRWHPLVGFGNLAQWLEQRLYGAAYCGAGQRRWRGVAALLFLILPLTAVVFFLLQALSWWLPQQWVLALQLLLEMAILTLAIGAGSLSQHALQVQQALQCNDIVLARTRTSYLVSRDTAQLDAGQLSRATIESTLENGNDAIFAPIFWFLLAGAPGVLCYRLVNTLDAMWGYRNDRYRHFGWAAARLDDVINFIPARLTALSYACVGHFNKALYCWRTQAKAAKSPNAGPVMAAGAGALAIQLGGAASYHGQLQQCPVLGQGSLPEPEDIRLAVSLLYRAQLLWLFVVVAGGFGFA